MAEQKKYLDKMGLTYFFNKIKEIFISDAPIDGKKYLRQDNNWVEALNSVGSYVNDETLMRAGDDMVVDGHTVAFTNDNIPVDIVIVDTPFDSKLYGRKNGNWEAIPNEWFGTQAEYDNLSTKDSNTKYYIYAK